MKQKAIFMALSDKVTAGALVIFDNLEFKEYKTKQFNTMLSALEKKILKNERRNILVVSEAKNEKTKYSGRNIVGVKIINLENINLIDLLNYKNLLLTANAVKVLTDRYQK